MIHEPDTRVNRRAGGGRPKSTWEYFQQPKYTAITTVCGYNPAMTSAYRQSDNILPAQHRGLSVCDCGVAEYRQILVLQQQLQEQRRAGLVGDTVLVVEHPPVITLGAHKSSNKLLSSPEELARRGIDLVEIRRGGGTTAHNPGQLVFYPILHLQQLGLDINTYVRTLEQIGIELLAELGVESDRKKGFPGLWVGPRKIASIGVRVSRFVTCHGMAINIQNDLGIFGCMVPCGLDGVVMTSAQKETGRVYEMNQIKEQLAALLHRHLGRAARSHES